MEASSGGSNIPKIMTFKPTWDEFKDFNKYIEYIESQGAHKAGICKIIPPKEWVPRRSGYDNLDITIQSPIQQVVHGKQGMYTQFNIQRKSIHYKDFVKLANSEKFKTPKFADFEDLERKYWKNITFINPMYGADVSGSLTDTDQTTWNICKLGSILDYLTDDYGISIAGVNTAYLYFGMWKTSFAWHTEDMDLYSINYIHFGAPKQWYAIPAEHGRRFERLAAGFFPDMHEQCPAFLRHKMSLISPMVLKRYSIPYDTIIQQEGEIMITFPYGYHSGFNHGLNCAESTNFATPRWIEYGKRCTQCHCRKDSVKIDMSTFVKRFQPKLYDLWMAGKDIAPHPEDDQSKLYNHHHHQELVNSLSPSKRAELVSKKKAPLNNKTNKPSLKRFATTDSLSTCMEGAAHFKAKRIKDETMSEDEYLATEMQVSVTLIKHSTEDTKKLLTGDDSDRLSTDLSDETTDVEPDVPAADKSKSESSEGGKKSRKTHTECSSKHSEKKQSSYDNKEVLEIEQPWAHNMTELWQFNCSNFETEVNYNIRSSTKAPYCAVCSVLNYQKVTNNQNVKSNKNRIPRTSVPELPPSCFCDEDDLDPLSSALKPTKPRALLVCSKCKVCVHDTCYGVKFLPNGPENWICSRCVAGATDAECALCCLRGGALKAATKGKWVHLVCAIGNSEVSLKNINQREPVDLSKISNRRATLKCSFCGVHSFKNGKDRYGKCVQCSVGQCNKSFHVTCARAAGLDITTGIWPYRLFITCLRHSSNSLSKRTEVNDRNEIKIGEEVYAKHKNGRYYLGEVVNIKNELFYCVIFDDNSTSRDLYPSDIINFQVSDGAPALGSYVHVKWPDGLIYYGHFQGTRTVLIYSVEFEDSSVVQVERDMVFPINEQLPPYVQKKLSYASEMKNDVFYRKDNELITDKRTRGVQMNYNHRWDI